MERKREIGGNLETKREGERGKVREKGRQKKVERMKEADRESS